MLNSLGWIALPGYFPWVALILGLCVGSFLNVLIHRLPKMMEREWRTQCAELTGGGVGDGAGDRLNLFVPRSRCPACSHRIAAWENIPVLSWLWLRGRCSACRARIGARYPLVELGAGAVAAYAASRYGFSWAAGGAMLYCWCLIALALIDLDTQLLPDDITLFLLWAGLALNIDATFVSLTSAVIGAMAGYLFLWVVYWAFKLATGKEGMGYGDFKLLAAIGAWLGWSALPLVVLLSSVVGAAVGIALILFRRHGREIPIPFGPYLAAAGLIALFWGGEIAKRWLPILA